MQRLHRGAGKFRGLIHIQSLAHATPDALASNKQHSLFPRPSQPASQSASHPSTCAPTKKHTRVEPTAYSEKPRFPKSPDRPWQTSSLRRSAKEPRHCTTTSEHKPSVSLPTPSEAKTTTQHTRCCGWALARPTSKQRGGRKLRGLASPCLIGLRLDTQPSIVSTGSARAGASPVIAG